MAPPMPNAADAARAVAAPTGGACRFAASSIAEMGGAAMAIGTARLSGRVFDALARGPAHA